MPESIGRYEVIDHIGTGAMADIYRARDPEIDREVAVKILKAGLDNEDDLERFLREARAAGALTHPNIVTIHDVGKVDDAPYITMELLEGQTLEDMLLVGHQLSELEVIEIAIDLAQALEYAHGQGVVHRDIKPSNNPVSAGHPNARRLLTSASPGWNRLRKVTRRRAAL